MAAFGQAGIDTGGRDSFVNDRGVGKSFLDNVLAVSADDAAFAGGFELVGRNVFLCRTKGDPAAVIIFALPAVLGVFDGDGIAGLQFEGQFLFINNARNGFLLCAVIQNIELIVILFAGNTIMQSQCIGAICCGGDLRSRAVGMVVGIISITVQDKRNSTVVADGQRIFCLYVDTMAQGRYRFLCCIVTAAAGDGDVTAFGAGGRQGFCTDLIMSQRRDNTA